MIPATAPHLPDPARADVANHPQSGIDDSADRGAVAADDEERSIGDRRAVGRLELGRWALRWAVPWLVPLVLVALWQVATTRGWVRTGILASPHEVWEAAVDRARGGDLQRDVVVSVRRVAIGYALGATVGLALGFLVGLSQLAFALLDRTLQMARVVPHLALVPLVIAWFGIDERPKLLLVALGTLFPVYLNTVGGIRNVDHKLVELGRGYGLSRLQIARQVVFPAALQPILVGLRYALGVGWLTLVVGETIASRTGIGYLAQNSRELLRTDGILLAIVLYAAIGFLIDVLARRVERRLLRWHPNYQRGAPA